MVCIDCGDSRPVVLEFDHRNPNEKKYSISIMVGRGHSWGSIQREIEKCDVVCANCHRIRTSKQYNWFYENMDV